MKYFNVQDYYYRGQFPQHQYNIEQEPKPKGESIFNLINDKESLNRINKIANQGVNHIVAAFYIKSVQQNRAKANETNNNLGRRTSVTSVPINSVSLDYKEDNEEIPQKNRDSNINSTKSNMQSKELKEKDVIDKESSNSDDATKDINKNNFNDNNLVNNNQDLGNQVNRENSVNKKEGILNNIESAPSKILDISRDKDLKTANFSINSKINNNESNTQSQFAEKNQTNIFDKDINKSKKTYGNPSTNSSFFQGYGNSTQYTQPSRYINNSSRPQSHGYNEYKPNSSFIKSSFSEDLNQFTAQQLNTVSNMVKRIKENKLSELIEKDNINSSNSLKK